MRWTISSPNYLNEVVSVFALSIYLRDICEVKGHCFGMNMHIYIFNTIHLIKHIILSPSDNKSLIVH